MHNPDVGRKPCNRDPPPSAQIPAIETIPPGQKQPLYLELTESKIFWPLRCRKIPQNLIFSYLIEFLCIISPTVDLFSTKLCVRTLKC